MKFVRILECRFHRNPFGLSLKIYDIVQHFRVLIQILDKTADPLFLMVDNMLHFLASAILINNREHRV